MGVLESRDIFFLHRFRIKFEVRMLNGIDCIDSFSPVKLQKFAEQRDGSGALLPENLWKISNSVWKCLHSVAPRKLAPAGHIVIVWRPDQFEDNLSLIKVTLACEDWLSFKHFSKDTPSAPHIDCRCIAPEL